MALAFFPAALPTAQSGSEGGRKAESPDPFTPFIERAYRLAQSISFSPNGEVMYLALNHREVLAHRGQEAGEDKPRLAIYSSRRSATGWSEPQALSFTGKHLDYEPTLSPDGRWLVFNSKRPWSPGQTEPRWNDLWIARWTGRDWGEPRRIDEVSTLEHEESYATLTKDGRMFYHRLRIEMQNGKEVEHSDIYESRMRNGRFSPPVRVEKISSELGEGDPCVAPDGSYLIFTRFDSARWRETCDLYVSFGQGRGWSEPLALTELNTAGPDFAAAVSPDGKWIYYRSNFQFMKRPWLPVLKAARARLESLRK